jgi:hypothetical protein
LIPTRIGRSEVREATRATDTVDLSGTRAHYKLLGILPFPHHDYPEQPSYEELGLPELQPQPASTATVLDDDIPF